ncbi:hypothetical protein MOO44_01620 (plasmid) [Nicoliella spurrieriana]|uniref:Uncharacterized protein n=1 Tax=Nicoliella spurrieriana TaxID=2925830 RepID=A0A976RR11_9LACO|nr:hypothetical protein [Nicoliella spurrieriana]UQS86046.1 hypothetical protein MOO44_01620 [Nicoliella spurrieriana]
MSGFNYSESFQAAIKASRNEEVIPMRDQLRLIAKHFITDDDINDPVIMNVAQEIFKLYAKIFIKHYQDSANYRAVELNEQQLDELWAPVTLTNLFQMLKEIDVPTIIDDVLAQRQLPTDAQRKNILATVDQIKTLHGNDLELAPIYKQVIELFEPVVKELNEANPQTVDFKKMVENTIEQANHYSDAKMAYCAQKNINNDMILSFNTEELMDYHKGIMATIKKQMENK